MAWAALWAGPMDGDRVFLGDGGLPARVGMHRTHSGDLVVIRTRALVQLEPMVAGQVSVYEHVTLDVIRAWRALIGPAGRLFDPGGAQTLEDVPLYVFRDVVTRWLAASS